MRTVLRIVALLVLGACASAPPSSKPPPREATGMPELHATSASSVSSSGDRTKREAAEIDAVEKAVQAYLDLLGEIHPEHATALGLHAHDHELDDRTLAGEDRATAREVAMLDALDREFAAKPTSPTAATNLVLLEGALKVDIRTRRVTRPLQRKPDVYVDALDAIFQLTAREFAPAEERAAAALARIEKLPPMVALAKDNLLNPPRIWTQIAIDKASGARSFLADQKKFLVSALPSETARIDRAIKAATASYEDYLGYLRYEVMKRSNGRFAAGRELFEYLLANDAFLEENADQLLATGKRVFAKTSDEMTALAKKIDPNAKDWATVAKKIKGKHPEAKELLATYKKEVARARDFLVQKDAVAFPDGEQLDVVDTPSFMRATISAAYDPAPAFASRGAKGFFFVTPVEASLPPAKQEEMLRENDFADIVDTSVHEAYPGHHLQLSVARTHPSRARRAFGHAIFEEGWGLYSEELMSELGYFDDEQRLIQLEWTLVRAARVIIDVGLHVGDMTYEQAVKMLTDEVHLERALAASEVRRYTEDPTQPSSYLIGREKILELRERVKQRDGAHFSLKAFHSDLLSRGSVPPSLTAREMF